ncbi:hypothetical protein [Kitasatospora sp. NPDC056731]|uniref:hypothetical protein n=1 Tax=Kitasatospora sp. NPDC056731 TaxID=3155422 RepID=UPI00342361EA
MFTLRFQTPGHHWYRTALTRADVERMVKIARRVRAGSHPSRYNAWLTHQNTDRPAA